MCICEGGGSWKCQKKGEIDKREKSRKEKKKNKSIQLL